MFTIIDLLVLTTFELNIKFKMYKISRQVQCQQKDHQVHPYCHHLPPS